MSVPKEVQNLQVALQSMSPRVQRELLPFVNAVADSVSRRRRILTLVQDALGQLRLDTKYLLFDLEATRRERDDAISS